ncbi:MAG: PqiC family protein [Bacteroidota bacterium]|nr:PqiC family protein [Bacteroidota bacterium]MDP4230707.1 PqiC family protein [Bacteroidota bacterium]
MNLLVVGLILLGMLGCGGSKPSRYYGLSAARGVTGDRRIDAPTTRIAIGIRTLKLPEYLLRPQIITRTANDELVAAEFDRWAEPLEKNFERVLIEDLSKDVPTNNIFLFPVRDSSVTNFQLVVEVTEFELSAGNNVTLSARWGITRGEEIVFLMNKRSTFSEHVQDEGFAPAVAAMSRLTEKLSAEIASEIREKALTAK